MNEVFILVTTAFFIAAIFYIVKLVSSTDKHHQL